MISQQVAIIFQESQLSELEKNLDKSQSVQQTKASCQQLHQLLSSLHKHIFSYCTVSDQNVSFITVEIQKIGTQKIISKTVLHWNRLILQCRNVSKRWNDK